MVWWRALEEEATAYYITYILSLFIAYDNLHLSTSPFAQIESGKLGSTFGIRRKKQAGKYFSRYKHECFNKVQRWLTNAEVEKKDDI